LQKSEIDSIKHPLYDTNHLNGKYPVVFEGKIPANIIINLDYFSMTLFTDVDIEVSGNNTYCICNYDGESG